MSQMVTMETTAKSIGASVTIACAEGTDIQKNWLNIVLPDEYNPMGVDLFRTMINAIAIGGSARDIAMSYCVAEMIGTSDTGYLIIQYTLPIIVNRSRDLEGKYDMFCSHSGVTFSAVRPAKIDKFEEIWTGGEDKVQLGWLPDTDTLRIDQTWPQQGVKYEVSQEDGILFCPLDKYLLLTVSGHALVDLYDLIFVHDFSTGPLPESISIEARWGDDKVVGAEIDIPPCSGPDGGDVSVNAKVRYIYYDACAGPVIEIRYRGDDG